MRPHPPTLSPAVRAVIRIAVGVGLLAALALVVGGEPFLRGLSAVTPTTIGVAAAFTAIATAVAAWRWRALARRLGAPLSWAGAIGAYYRSQLLNSILPGGVVGDVHRAVDHGRRTGRLADASRAVVAERVAGQVVQLIAAVVVLVVLGVRLDIPSWEAAVSAAAIVAICAVVLGSSRRARAVVAREATIVGTAFRDPATLAQTVIASLLVVAAHTATFVVACVAVGVDADPARLVAVALITVLAGSIPLSVGGWGTREAIAGWAFAAVGLGAAAGIAASTAFGVLTTIAVLPGLGVLAASAFAGRPIPAPSRPAPSRPAPSSTLSSPPVSHRESA